MQTRRLKLIWRRKYRRSQKQVQGLSDQTDDFIEKHLYDRLHKLNPVKRFVFSWLGLVLLLIVLVIAQDISLSGYYQSPSTIAGGIYSEGIPGVFTNSNPIYAQTDADQTVSRLIFGSLFTTNAAGQLVGELASSYSVDSIGKTYTLNLKPNLYWQDGKQLTAQDVVFTVDTIENPLAQSPLYSNWVGIKAYATNPNTVVFKLPDVLASFPQNLTLGIIPEHILSVISPEDLRSANFNTISPIGSGPFSFQGVQVINGSSPSEEQVKIELTPYPRYVLGQPKLNKYIVNVYADQSKMLADFKSKDLSGIEAAEQPKSSILNSSGVVTHNLILRAATMVFFKTSVGVLSDQNVRNALVEGTDVPSIISNLNYPTIAVNEPFLIGQYAYNPQFKQSSYNLTNAINTLNADGFTTIKNGIRYKANQPLSFTLSANNTLEARQVTNELKSQWKKLGVLLNVQLLASSDFATTLSYHQYDAVLTSITIGSDPDVFVYWDSSQANTSSVNRDNFSEFNDGIADESLQGGRISLLPALRAIKYQTFLGEWQKQSPALGLYQPRLLYLTNGPVNGLDYNVINSPVDRLNNVQNWEIREAKVTDK